MGTQAGAASSSASSSASAAAAATVAEEEAQTAEVLARALPARVRFGRVRFGPLVHTHPDVVARALEAAGLATASTLAEALAASSSAVALLESLGSFTSVSAAILRSSTAPALPAEGAGDVVFDVDLRLREAKRLGLEVGTSIDAAVGVSEPIPGARGGGWHADAVFRNALGRGESVSLKYTRKVDIGVAAAAALGGSARHGVSALFLGPSQTLEIRAAKPLWSLFDPFRAPLVDLSAGAGGVELPESSVQADVLHAALRLRVLPFDAAYELALRRVHPLAGAGPAIRSDAGLSLKSALRVAVDVDERDSPQIPSRGVQRSVSLELAGLGGDVCQARAEAAVQANWPIPLPASLCAFPRDRLWLQLALRAGVVLPLPRTHAHGPAPRRTHILDRLFLGGPASVRGFEHMGIGEHTPLREALGGDAFVSGGAYLVAPLFPQPPRLRPLPTAAAAGSAGGLAEQEESDWDQPQSLLCAQAFVNFGSVGALASCARGLLIRESRSSAGVGLVLRHGDARIELNYAWPLRVFPGDRPARGLQIGVSARLI